MQIYRLLNFWLSLEMYKCALIGIHTGKHAL